MMLQGGRDAFDGMERMHLTRSHVRLLLNCDEREMESGVALSHPPFPGPTSCLHQRHQMRL